MRTIFHIDMNAFFAAVEQQSNPALRGKPVAVIGRRQRTIILTASYEARVFGVKTGMMVHEAKRLCPGLQLVPANNPLYTHVSSGIIDLFFDYTPQVEVFSIDEAFLDVTGSLDYFGSAERIAYLIKSRIKTHFGMTCSVGVAPNKLLAKLASDLQKPDGLTFLQGETIPALLETLPVGELCGIGRKTAEKLQRMGIETCAQLGRTPVEKLRARFGIVGQKLALMGQGIDDSPVLSPEQEADVKTVGHGMTLDRDISDRCEIDRFLLQLSEMVGRRARRYQVAGRTLTLTVRFADFTSTTHQRVQSQPICRGEEIYQAARQLFDELIITQPVRLLGVRLSSLTHQGGQLPLFAQERKQESLTCALDQVNDRYGEFAVMPASLLPLKGKGSHVISPAWRPQGIRKVEVL